MWAIPPSHGIPGSFWDRTVVFLENQNCKKPKFLLILYAVIACSFDGNLCRPGPSCLMLAGRNEKDQLRGGGRGAQGSMVVPPPWQDPPPASAPPRGRHAAGIGPDAAPPRPPPGPRRPGRALRTVCPPAGSPTPRAGHRGYCGKPALHPQPTVAQNPAVQWSQPLRSGASLFRLPRCHNLFFAPCLFCPLQHDPYDLLPTNTLLHPDLSATAGPSSVVK